MVDEEKPVILLVDDEEGILKSLSRVLHGLNVNILTASNGAEALEIIGQQKIALIISDQRMPGMTGVEMLSKSRDISPDSIRILLTGYADMESTVAAINGGAISYYFNKPWDNNMLTSRIVESLDLHAAKSENKRLEELTRHQNDKLKELNNSLQQKVEEQTFEIKERHRELNQSFMETIKAFSTFLELRYKEVGSHSQRVASLVKCMLEEYDLNEKEYQDIVVAAYLHDIGKISLPDKVLAKAGDKLSARESELVREHPIFGQLSLQSISGFEEIGIIIRHHHEAYDGSGYPESLCEQSIPFGSRLIRICDAFDHDAFREGYPDLKTLKAASGRLFQYSGSEYDPDLVRKFMDLNVAAKLFHDETSHVRRCEPDQLVEGMVVATDIYTRNGMFLLPKGAKLSHGVINRIRKIHSVDPVVDMIRVYSEKVVKNEASAPA